MLKPVHADMSQGIISRVEPCAATLDRGHDDPEHASPATQAILHQRGFEVQPAFRPLAG